ncbi:MAG: methanol dehydrogenase [Candidatus Solibacter sp.]|nr:methanol dehydrogenase [Candidatus Solibacter sp.]
MLMGGMKTNRVIGLALAAVLLCGTAAGADFAALRPEGYVSDFARVIPAERKAELERYCKAVEASTGAEIALVTVPSLEGEPIEDVANLLHRKWGLGKKGTDEGVLVLLSIRDRRSRIEVGYGLEGVLPDGYAGSLLREMRPALKAGDIGGAMGAAAQAIGDKVAAEKGVRIEERVSRSHQPREGVAWEGLIPLVVAGGVLFGVLFLANSGRRGRGRRGGGGSAGDIMTGVLLGLLSSPPRTYGGGGFGGYDSGDSFGGFGGGDSGGGGASSDW